MGNQACDDGGAARGARAGRSSGRAQHALRSSKRGSRGMRRGTVLVDSATMVDVVADAVQRGGLAGVSSAFAKEVNEGRHGVVGHRPRGVPHDHGSMAQALLHGRGLQMAVSCLTAAPS